MKKLSLAGTENILEDAQNKIHRSKDERHIYQHTPTHKHTNTHEHNERERE
jgi:hypothetical protein